MMSFEVAHHHSSIELFQDPLFNILTAFKSPLKRTLACEYILDNIHMMKCWQHTPLQRSCVDTIPRNIINKLDELQVWQGKKIDSSTNILKSLISGGEIIKTVPSKHEETVAKQVSNLTATTIETSELKSEIEDNRQSRKKF